MVLGKQLVNGSLPAPHFMASSRELSATVLYGNVLKPFWILMQETCSVILEQSKAQSLATEREETERERERGST
jgi:hypothetical protein